MVYFFQSGLGAGGGGVIEKRGKFNLVVKRGAALLF